MECVVAGIVILVLVFAAASYLPRYIERSNARVFDRRKRAILKTLGIDDSQLERLGMGGPDYFGQFVTLDLSHTNVDDAAFQQLKPADFPNLWILDLSHTRITKASADHINRLKPHQSLYLPKSFNSEEARRQIHCNCYIFVD
ncbi:MAG TPA: hypothetical protein VMM76_14365 [Pirellulaceae bacterium]|nr:hypothetical protein [Pirellulaceae bacterium]